jgi:hypothetical protein
MRDELEDIKIAVEDGNLELARSLADTFVADNGNLFMDIAAKNVEDLVNSVDILRSAGMENEHWLVEAWLLHRFEPQKIGGPAEATVRVVQ